MRRLLGFAVAIGFVSLTEAINISYTVPSNRTDIRTIADEHLISPCNSITPKQQQEINRFIYKIESNYMVYVQPSWHLLRIDEKKGLAAYIAECRLGGSARFLDSRTGKLLARWGSNGYVNYED